MLNLLLTLSERFPVCRLSLRAYRSVLLHSWNSAVFISCSCRVCAHNGSYNVSYDTWICEKGSVAGGQLSVQRR